MKIVFPVHETGDVCDLWLRVDAGAGASLVPEVQDQI